MSLLVNGKSFVGSGKQRMVLHEVPHLESELPRVFILNKQAKLSPVKRALFSVSLQWSIEKVKVWKDRFVLKDGVSFFGSAGMMSSSQINKQLIKRLQRADYQT